MPPVEISLEEYHAAEGISKSGLDLIHRSPAHYRQERVCPTPATPAMLWGSMFHMLVLQPDLFAATYAVLPEGIDRRTKDGREIWEAWQAEHEGFRAVDKPTMEELNAMRDSVFGHSRARELLSGGIAEQSLFWEDGVRCKARPDYSRAAILSDLKTAVDARPEAFSRACWTYRYHVQSAYYSDGFRATFDQQVEAFAFIVVEKTLPYAVAVYLADESMVKQGRAEYAVDLEIYRECLAKDQWPGYPPEILSIELPYWAQETRS